MDPILVLTILEESVSSAVGWKSREGLRTSSCEACLVLFYFLVREVRLISFLFHFFVWINGNRF